MNEPFAQAAEEGLEQRRMARLRWRCRRGLLELEVMLARFLDERYTTLGPAERRAFERLLDIPDAQLLAYLNAAAEPQDRELRELVGKL